jgi:hypothetical protein
MTERSVRLVPRVTPWIQLHSIIFRKSDRDIGSLLTQPKLCYKGTPDLPTVCVAINCGKVASIAPLDQRFRVYFQSLRS